MKKTTLKWNPKVIVAKSHPGCCTQNGGCGRKHG